MQFSTEESLRILAPVLLIGKIPQPCFISAQRAIAILEILKDGEWHTVRAIAKELGLSVKYVSDILRICKDGWGLATHRRNGWILVIKQSVILK